MLTLGTKVICSGGRYGYSLQSGRRGKCRVTLRAGRPIGSPLLSQTTPWKGLEQGMRPGTRRPRSPTVYPTPAPPASARRGAEPSLVPHAEGLPAAGPRPRVLRLQHDQRDHQHRRRQRRAQGCGQGHPAIPPARRLSSPRPTLRGPLPGPRLPDFVFRVTSLYRRSPRPQGRDVEGWPARGPEGAWALARGPQSTCAAPS